MQGRKLDYIHPFLGMSANIRNRNIHTCIQHHHKCLGKPSNIHQVLTKRTNTVGAEVEEEGLAQLALQNQNY
jgi:hypothetical protein